ncbi:MAG: ribose 5-phosphate isomerase B [Acidobacteriota bacterium]
MSDQMRKVITERDLPESGELKVEAGTIFTPSARDAAAARGIRIVAATAAGRVAIGADHGGFRMKEALKPLLAELGLDVHDVGVHEETPVDYPDIAAQVADLVAQGQAERGIIIDGAGIGSAIAANKAPGIRAALCYDKASARNSREHNDANVLTLGGRLLTVTQAEEVLRTWLATPFAGGRHAGRVRKIAELEKRYAGRGYQSTTEPSSAS